VITACPKLDIVLVVESLELRVYRTERHMGKRRVTVVVGCELETWAEPPPRWPE